MRDILFKAKRLDNGEWVEGYYLKKHGVPFIYETRECPQSNYEVDETTLCQYTGLEDKNGKKIWENDILKYSYDYHDSPWLEAAGKTNDDIVYRTGHVYWQNWRGAWAVTTKVGNCGMNTNVFTYCRNPNRTEVIGNLFDGIEVELQLIKEATFVCCPMCDEKKCVGRFNCEEIKQFIKHKKDVE